MSRTPEPRPNSLACGLPTVRSVSVSPSKASFGNCSGGNPNNDTASTADALGYPNGRCWVGQPAEGQNAGSFPITITNTGIASYIDVNGANAVPSDAGTEWGLCNLGPKAAIGCKGRKGRPAMDQYVLVNFAPGGKSNSSGLTGSLTCDDDFGTAGGCRTEQGDAQQEGVKLVGPGRPDDTSTSWTVTITWTAVPPGYQP